MKTHVVVTRLKVVNEAALYAGIGRKLREARTRKGWTLAQVGIRVGHTRASINNMELGNQRMPIHVLYNVALVLGIDARRVLP